MTGILAWSTLLLLLPATCVVSASETSAPALHLVQRLARVVGPHGQHGRASPPALSEPRKFRCHEHYDPLPYSLVLLKTHKTGGSTMANIFNRLGDCRHLDFLLPCSSGKLGWPGAFPGECVREHSGDPAHQYDVITNHAVFNRELMVGYMRKQPFFVGIVREPASHGVSAFNYYRDETDTWDDHLSWLEGLKSYGDQDQNTARFLNGQAHDFGWYEAVHQTLEQDHQPKRRRAWLTQLDETFGGSSGMVLLTEHFDEGLVLLGQRLRFGLHELAYIRMKENSTLKKQLPFLEPTGDQVQRLLVANSVDVALYSHFNQSFWLQWQAVSDDTSLAKFRGLNLEVQNICLAPFPDNMNCPKNVRLDALAYAKALLMKQQHGLQVR